MKVIEFDKKCQACNGSGIYVGEFERDGIGVVCMQCKGTARVQVRIEYEPFRCRTQRDDVLRVIATNPGIVCANSQECRIEDFGGMDYEAWLAGIPFLPGMEMRKYACPSSWHELFEVHKSPEWKECEKVCEVDEFSQCSRFAQKEQCWARWDEEQKEMNDG